MIMTVGSLSRGGESYKEAAAAEEEEECAVKRQSWIAAAMFAAALSLTHSLDRSFACLLG